MGYRFEGQVSMRPCNVSSVRVAAPLLAYALLAGNGFAQTQPPPQNPAPATTATAPGSASTPQSSASSTTPPAVFKSTAALVLVDVLVTNGVEEIHGIPRQQFRLLEDGKEQKLI